MNEQHMTDLVERVGDTLEPDIAGLVAVGAARGRVRRRRRNVAAVATGVAAVMAVGALGYALVPGEGDTGVDGATVATSPTPSSAAAPEAKRHFGPDPGKMGWVLGDLLDGEVSERRAWHDDLGTRFGFQSGSVLLDGARVTLILQHTPRQDGCGELPPGRPCDVVPGGLVTGGTYEEPASGGGSTGIFASTATYFTADGFSITATAWNAPGEKESDPVAAEPVLTEDELYDLVRDPVWLDAHQ